MEFKELVNRILVVHAKFPNKWDRKTELLNLMEELGELCNAVLVDAGDKPEKRRRAELNDSFADVYLALVATANACGVNLEEVMLKALGEIETRQKQGEYED